MGWLIFLGAVLLLCIMPLGIRAHYGEEGPTVDMLIGLFRLQLYPGRKKDKKASKQGKNSGESKFESYEQAKKEKKNSLSDFLSLIPLILDFLVDFKSRIKVRMLQLKLLLAGSDPCDLSVNYGRTWAAVGNLMPILDRFFVIKKQDVQIDCDYTAEVTTVCATLELTITLGRLLQIALSHGARILRAYYAIIKKQRMVLQHESKSS